jgi:hypothetical protein
VRYTLDGSTPSRNSPLALAKLTAAPALRRFFPEPPAVAKDMSPAYG